MTSVSTLLTTVGLAEQALDHGERRLVARLAAVALDRAEDRGLLAADVGAGALAHLDVEGEALRRGCPAPRKPRSRASSIAFSMRAARQRILAAHVEVAVLAAGGVGGDGHRLDDGERVALHQHAVLERAGLGLVGVADQVVRAARLARHGVPLAARREGGAAAPDELGVDHLADARPRGRARSRAAARRSRRGRGSRRGSRGRPGRRAAAGAAPGRPACGGGASSGGSGGVPPSRIVDDARRRRRASARARAARRRPRSAAPPGARSHWPRHGLRSHEAPSTSVSSGPKRSLSSAMSASEPAQRQATSSQTWTTRGGRSSVENSA